MAVNLIDNKATLVRENNPWPNCVHIISDLTEISLAGSSESCADELLEKLYEAQHEAVQYVCFFCQFYLEIRNILLYL